MATKRKNKPRLRTIDQANGDFNDFLSKKKSVTKKKKNKKR